MQAEHCCRSCVCQPHEKLAPGMGGIVTSRSSCSPSPWWPISGIAQTPRRPQEECAVRRRPLAVADPLSVQGIRRIAVRLARRRIQPAKIIARQPSCLSPRKGARRTALAQSEIRVRQSACVSRGRWPGAREVMQPARRLCGRYGRAPRSSSSITAAIPGTASSNSPGASCRSAAIGRPRSILFITMNQEGGSLEFLEQLGVTI